METTVLSGKIDVSVSVPIFNEVENVPLLYGEIKEVMEALGRSYEILFVNDGSTDGSLEALKKIAEADSLVRIISFRRNFGQTAALDAGFRESRGDVIITMDGDLQNDPRDIPRLLEKMEEGNYDIVSGWRKDRKDKFITRRIPSIIANKLIGKITSVRLHDYGCTLKAYSRDLADNFKLYGEMHRFLPAYGRLIGAKITEIPVNHRPRQFGTSKYGLSRTLRVVLDLLTVKFFMSYHTQPIKIIGRMGIFFFFLTFLSVFWVIWDKVANNQDMTNSPWFYLAIVGFFTGVQLITMGLLAEIQVRTYFESQDKPTYYVKERINFPEEEDLV